jgi:hypothetical protein
MKPITLYTSLSPTQLETSILAVNSWLRNGFHVVSMNSKNEIIKFHKLLKNVHFIENPLIPARVRLPAWPPGLSPAWPPILSPAAATNADAPPLLDTVLKQVPLNEIFGLINGDILLNISESYIHNLIKDRLLLGQRVDVDNYNLTVGKIFSNGFDYFFLNSNMLTFLPASKFQLGRPAWDYWFPYKLQQAVKSFRITDHIAYHKKHVHKWNQNHYKQFCNDLYLQTGMCETKIYESILQQAEPITLAELSRLK